MNAPTNAADFKRAPKATDSKYIGALLSILLMSAFQKDRTDKPEQPSPAPKAENTKSEAPKGSTPNEVALLQSVLANEMGERVVPQDLAIPVTAATRILMEQKYELLAMRKQIESMQAGNMVETGDGMVCVHHLVDELVKDLVGKQAVIDFLSDKLDLPTD